MLNIPETVKALYKQDGVNKNFRAHFPGGELPDITNENIVQESVKFQESVCSQDVFKFGLTEASVIEFETVGIANMYGMTMECSSEIDCSSLTAAELAEIEAGTWDGEMVFLPKGETGEESGSIVTIPGESVIETLSVDVEPQQDLHGYHSPWPAGGGKNLCPHRPATTYVVPATKLEYTVNDDGSVILNGKAENTAFYGTPYSVETSAGYFLLPAGNYILNGQNGVDAENKKITLQLYDVEIGKQICNLDTAADYPFTLSKETKLSVRIGVRVGAVASNVKLNPMIRLASETDATFAPYSNICPISGWDSVDIMHSGTDTSNPTTYTIQIGQTVYGGTLDVTGGKMVVDRAIIVLDGTSKKFGYKFPDREVYQHTLSTPAKAVSGVVLSKTLCDKLPTKTDNQVQTASADAISTNTTGAAIKICLVSENLGSLANANEWLTSNPLQVCYELATPFEISLTPTQITTLVGQTNTIWADAGDVTVSYVEGVKFFRVPYGTFRVESCPRDHQAMAHRRVTAYTQNGCLTEKSIFPSEYPTSKLTFSPDVWIAANSLKNEDYEMHSTLTAVPYEGNNIRSIRFPPYDAYTSGMNYLRFDGVKIAGTNTFLESFYPTDYSPEIESFKRIGVYALKIDFQPSKFDEYAKHFTDAALAHLPSGAYVYSASGVKVFQNTKQTISANMGQFAPCYFIVVEYRKSGTTPLSGGDVWRRYSKPIFIKAGDVNIVDMTRLDDFAYWNGKNSAYPILDRVELHVSVPKFWYQFANWEVLTGSGTDSYSVGEDWYSGIPFEEYGEPLVIGTTTYSYMVTREGVVDVYLHKLTDSSSFRISAENTLDYTKGSTFRPYYTYENALSTEEIINGALELHAQFMKTDRSGEMSFVRLENDLPEAVTPGDYSQMWFDEYDVQPIGTIRYSYTDEAGEEQVVDYQFGDGSSVYDMTDNAVLKAMDGASPTIIESLLDTSFIPHLSAVNFTPIDLEAKGLPYIEAGDALAVTAQDGTVCSSYALRRELDGVQVLTDQIDSQSGLIIDSEEGA